MTKYLFLLRDISAEDFAETEEEIEEIEAHDCCKCTITGTAVNVDNDFNHNYYDIIFDDGFELYAVSGYHLI